MNALLAVAKRDLVERRNVFFAAAFLAIVPFVVQLFWRAQAMDSRDSRVATAVALGLGLAAAVALIHGSSMLGPDLAERRAGFYFARPLPAWAIWWGKLLAGTLLVIGVPIFIILPSLLPGGLDDFKNDAWLAVPFAVLGLLLLLVGAHVASVALRSHSPWLILDVIALPAVIGATWLLCRILQTESATEMFVRALIGCAIGLLFALLAAGAVQTVLGRTDIRRGHRALSITLWSGLSVLVVALGTFAHWVLNVTVADLTWPHVVSVPVQGEWLTVYGRPRHRGDYEPVFLFNPASGKELGLSSRTSGMLYSGDGRVAAWFAPSERFSSSSPWQLVAADLTGPEPRLRRIIASPIGQLALSPDGRLAAIRNPKSHTLSLVDLQKDQLLAATQVASNVGATISFVGPDRVRLYSTISHDPTSNTCTIAIEEMTPDSPKLVRTGTLTSVTGARSFLRNAMWDPAQDRLLLEERGTDWERPGITLYNARSGERVAHLTAPGTVVFPEATFLTDGRVAVGESADGHARVRLLGPHGEEGHVVNLGPGVRVSIGTEPEPGRLLLCVYHRTAYDVGAADLLELDVMGLTTRKVPGGWSPIDRDAVGDWLPRPPAPGSLSSRLLDASGIGYGIYDPAGKTVQPVLSTR